MRFKAASKRNLTNEVGNGMFVVTSADMIAPPETFGGEAPWRDDINILPE
jgi:hypothetical protein